LEIGTLSGRVASCSAPIARATVHIPGHSFSALTDDSGGFTLYYIPPGTYALAVEASGQPTKTLSGVQVMASQLTNVGQLVVTDLISDPNNCGACGVVCGGPNETSVCLNGVCEPPSCNAGYGDCDRNPANGCETNLNTSS